MTSTEQIPKGVSWMTPLAPQLHSKCYIKQNKKTTVSTNWVFKTYLISSFRLAEVSKLFGAESLGGRAPVESGPDENRDEKSGRGLASGRNGAGAGCRNPVGEGRPNWNWSGKKANAIALVSFYLDVTTSTHKGTWLNWSYLTDYKL